jgi:uncharacterized phage infection (PIP) family protein YhgE
MKKLLTIGLKDLRVAFRDRAALIMLVAPFVLTLAMGFVTGSFSQGGSGLERIPIAVVNQDGRESRRRRSGRGADLLASR